MGFCPHDGTRLADAPADDSPIDPMIGVVLGGRYRILGAVGAGGFGTVYRAQQTTVDMEVAIKVLSLEASRNQELVRRFENEARIISQLRHPNTLKLVDFGRTPDRRCYLVTEFLTGLPLDKLLLRGPLDSIRMLSIFGQVCESVAEAHERGIVHRDLKPANIFVERVSQQDVAKVLDFGIAKITEGITVTTEGQVMGTPPYMSPEQCRGEAIDARSDLYSLGVLAYECLSGHTPFSAPTPMAVLLKHIHDVPRPLSGSLSIDPELDALVLSLLAKRREDRPQSATAVRRILTRIERRIDVRDSVPHGSPAIQVKLGARVSNEPSDAGFAPTEEVPLHGPPLSPRVESAVLPAAPRVDTETPTSGERVVTSGGREPWEVGWPVWARVLAPAALCGVALASWLLGRTETSNPVAASGAPAASAAVVSLDLGPAPPSAEPSPERGPVAASAIAASSPPSSQPPTAPQSSAVAPTRPIRSDPVVRVGPPGRRSEVPPGPPTTTPPAPPTRAQPAPVSGMAPVDFNE